MTGRAVIVRQVFLLLRSGGRGLQKFHKPAAEGGVPRSPLLACVDKLSSQVGKLGAQVGNDQPRNDR